MAQNYVAFASTGIRRIAAPPDRRPKVPPDKRFKVVSLAVLLEEIESNAHLLTFKRFENLYRRNVRRQAQYDWKKHVGKKHKVVPQSLVQRDLKRVVNATEKVRRLVNKSVAHNEEDRRLRGTQRFVDINRSIDVLHRIFTRYHLLITAREPPDVGDVFADVEDDLGRIWP
jgi:hypothetical protein